MRQLVRDSRTALRAFARKPGMTALAVTSLTLAIGFSTAAFSVLDAYSFRDLPSANLDSFSGSMSARASTGPMP